MCVLGAHHRAGRALLCEIKAEVNGGLSACLEAFWAEQSVWISYSSAEW